MKISQIWVKHNIALCRLQYGYIIMVSYVPMPNEIKPHIVHPNELHEAHTTGRILSISLQCANFTRGIILVSISAGFSFVWIFCNWCHLHQDLPNKVEPDINMVHPCMIYLVLCQIDSTHAITIDLQQILINYQVVKQHLKPNCLLHSLRHGYILGLRSRLFDSRL